MRYLRKLVIAAILIVGTLTFDHLFFQNPNAGEWERRADSLLAVAGSFHDGQQIALAEVRRLTDSMSVLVTRAGQTRTIIHRDSSLVSAAAEAVRLSVTQADSIIALVAQVSAQEGLIARQGELIQNQDSQIRVLTNEVAILSGARDNAENRVLELEDLLTNRPGRCKIVGLVPCPSRAAMFVIGAVVGGAIVVSLP